MKTYRDIIHRPYFTPVLTAGPELHLPIPMRWGGAEDAEGATIEVHFDGQPVFCEAVFDGDLLNMNLMLELNGRWFAKKPGINRIDFLSAFWEKPIEGEATLQLNIFAPPADGINHDDGHADWDINYRTELSCLPSMRIRYEGCLPMC